MMHLLPLLIAFVGFFALASAMKRHQRDLLGKTLTEAQMRLAWTAGWLTLGLGWTVSGVLLGPAMGTIAWLGELSVGAALTVATLNWRTGRRAR